MSQELVAAMVTFQVGNATLSLVLGLHLCKSCVIWIYVLVTRNVKECSGKVNVLILSFATTYCKSVSCWNKHWTNEKFAFKSSVAILIMILLYLERIIKFISLFQYFLDYYRKKFFITGLLRLLQTSWFSCFLVRPWNSWILLHNFWIYH